MVLARMAKRRAHRIRLALADALDLLVVSVEAGLGLDQALHASRPASSRSRIPISPTSSGSSTSSFAPARPRPDALRNLADRTGVEDLGSLVTMLIQTDKFGTSVAQALRVYSETLRTKRRQRAEEAAAKTGVKMVFPLVILHLPGNLGRHDRSGRDQVHHSAAADGRRHQVVQGSRSSRFRVAWR